jgi:polar amino acid transport system substrate-binding protein
VLFSDPYSALTIYVLAPKSLTIKGAEDLKSVSIGVARASTQDTAITAIAPEGTQIKRFDDDATALQEYANTFIAEIVKNGELSKINERWFGVPLDQLPPMPKI